MKACGPAGGAIQELSPSAADRGAGWQAGARLRSRGSPSPSRLPGGWSGGQQAATRVWLPSAPVAARTIDRAALPRPVLPGTLGTPGPVPGRDKLGGPAPAAFTGHRRGWRAFGAGRGSPLCVGLARWPLVGVRSSARLRPSPVGTRHPRLGPGAGLCLHRLRKHRGGWLGGPGRTVPAPQAFPEAAAAPGAAGPTEKLPDRGLPPTRPRGALLNTAGRLPGLPTGRAQPRRPHGRFQACAATPGLSRTLPRPGPVTWPATWPRSPPVSPSTTTLRVPASQPHARSPHPPHRLPPSVSNILHLAPSPPGTDSPAAPGGPASPRASHLCPRLQSSL